jgi:MoxR-like ATPase
MERDQSLTFRPGVFLRALAQHQWLLVDELNRADVDRAFGELLTLLAGAAVDTPFIDHRGRAVSLGFDREHAYFVAPSFRVIATMNTWDRSSLFRLSYALLRRFAVVTVDAPDETTFHALIDHAAQRDGFDPPIDASLAQRVQRLFSRQSLLRERALGPALALDLVRYLRRRGGAADALAEGVEMFVLPQLDGLVDEAARRVEQAMISALGDALSDEARAQLIARVRELGGGVV